MIVYLNCLSSKLLILVSLFFCVCFFPPWGFCCCSFIWEIVFCLFILFDSLCLFICIRLSFPVLKQWPYLHKWPLCSLCRRFWQASRNRAGAYCIWSTRQQAGVALYGEPTCVWWYLVDPAYSLCWGLEWSWAMCPEMHCSKLAGRPEHWGRAPPHPKEVEGDINNGAHRHLWLRKTLTVPGSSHGSPAFSHLLYRKLSCEEVTAV